MIYQPKVNLRRGFVVEHMQPITKYDINLIKQALTENDEVVVGIGSAQISHDKGYLMTSGERVDLVNYTLKKMGIEPTRYIIIPIENKPDNASWVSEIRRVTPIWHTAYTRNFKNASVLRHFAGHYGFEVKTISEQKPEVDYYEQIARDGLNSIDDLLDPTINRLDELAIGTRARIVYNRENLNEEPKNANRALFLGGFQPFTGVYGQGNGHLGMVEKGIREGYNVVIGIGSGQESHKMSDPLTVGERIDVIRGSLLGNEFDPEKFYTIPINDISDNAGYAAKVVSMTPRFNAVIAGNDWTKQFFGEGRYQVIPVERSPDRMGLPISASRVRKDTAEILKANVKKGEEVQDKVRQMIEERLADLVDQHTLLQLNTIGYYERMNFLTHAVE